MLSQVPRARARSSNSSRFSQAIFFVILALGISATTAFGQTGSAQDSGTTSGQAGRRQMPSVDDQLQKLTQALTLSEEQQARIKPMLENQRTQMEAIRGDSSGSRRERFAKMRDIHDTTVSQVKGVLNDDQKKKYEEIQDKMKQEGRRRMRPR